MNIRLISALLEALISGDATFDFGLDAWRGKKFGPLWPLPNVGSMEVPTEVSTVMALYQL